MNSTPASLLEQLRHAPDAETWKRFVDLYTPLLFFWARKVGLQEEDAADLVQDVFVVLLQKLPDFRYDRQRSFRGWLRAVTLNRWRDRFKKRAEVVDGPLIETACVDPQESFWEDEYNRFLVGRALEVMRQEFQATTWKACWELVVCSKPAADVARELGLSENAVYVAKSRVLRRLRQELEGLLDY